MQQGNAAEFFSRIIHILDQFVSGGDRIVHVLIKNGMQDFFFAFEIKIDSTIGDVRSARAISATLELK